MAIFRTVLVLLAALLPATLASAQGQNEPLSEERGEKRGEKRIALSFDDAPRFEGDLYSDDERAIRLIAALDDAGVKQAAFFVNPGNLAQRSGGEARITAYVAAGHVIANHTFSHPRLSETAVWAYMVDIDAARDWLSGRKGYRPWFRYPYLDEGGDDKAKRDAIRDALARRKLRNGYVTVDASDWFYDAEFSKANREGKTVNIEALKELFVESHVEAAATYDRIAKEALGRSPAHVMLLHESDVTVLALPDLIAALKADGWTMITADEAYSDPIGEELPDVPFSQGTITEMLAWERGMPAPRWYDRNDTRLAAKLFGARVLNETPKLEE